MNRIVCAFIAIAALGSTPARATVARGFFVVVATDEDLERDALRLQISTSQAVGNDPRLELVDPTGSARVAAGREATTAVNEVAELVAQIDYPRARTRAENAIAALRGADFRVVRAQTLQLLVQLARIKLALKADDGGSAELSQALVLDPALAAPRDLNSKERSWFEGAKRSVEATPRAAAVVIESSSANGWVWLDGQFLGVTPVSVPRPLAGRHFITFAAPGIEPLHRSELFGAIGRVLLTAPPSEAGRNQLALLASLAAGFRKGAPETAGTDLLRWSKSDELIAVALSGKGSRLKATVFRLSSAGALQQTISLPEEGQQAPALADAVLALFESPIGARANPAPAAGLEAPLAPSELSVRKSNAPAIAMFAVALAAVAVGAGLVGGGQVLYGDARATPQAETETYRQRVELGRGLTGGGIAGFGLAAVALGVGVVFAW